MRGRGRLPRTWCSVAGSATWHCRWRARSGACAAARPIADGLVQRHRSAARRWRRRGKLGMRQWRSQSPATSPATWHGVSSSAAWRCRRRSPAVACVAWQLFASDNRVPGTAGLEGPKFRIRVKNYRKPRRAESWQCPERFSLRTAERVHYQIENTQPLPGHRRNHFRTLGPSCHRAVGGVPREAPATTRNLLTGTALSALSNLVTTFGTYPEPTPTSPRTANRRLRAITL